MKKLVRNVLRSSWVQRAVGFLAAEYLRLVWLTNRFTFDPANVYELVEPAQPAIFAFWHGLLPSGKAEVSPASMRARSTREPGSTLYLFMPGKLPPAGPVVPDGRRAFR